MIKKIFYEKYGDTYELKTEWQVVFILVIGILLISALAVFCYVAVDWPTCQGFARINPSLSFKWTFLNGCLVHTEGMDIWIPVENIRTLVQ